MGSNDTWMSLASWTNCSRFIFADHMLSYFLDGGGGGSGVTETSFVMPADFTTMHPHHNKHHDHHDVGNHHDHAMEEKQAESKPAATSNIKQEED